MIIKERRAIFAGSFDPVTNGHIDIIKRASKLFDKLFVCISVNPDKKSMFTFEERVELLEECLKDSRNIEIVSYDGLLVKYCKEHDIDVLVRGIRGGSDTEYELHMAYMNKTLNSEIETVILPTKTEYSFVSSSLIKQVVSFGGDVETLVPKNVLRALKIKIAEVKINV